MPAHNEQDYLERAVTEVVEGLRSRNEAFEVVIVENGSVDATADVASALAAAEPEVRSLTFDVADYGAALREGILAARSEWAVIFDVDYVDLVFLAEARTHTRRTGAAIVVGSKRGPGAEDGRSPARKIITAGFTLMLRVGFGLKVSDTHGLKLLHIPPLRELVAVTKHSKEIFDTEVIIRAERAGLKVEELPVHVTDQRPPRSSILRRIPRTLVGLCSLRLTLWRERGRGER